MPLASSTVMTPSLPTFCIAWAIILPISVSPLAEMEPTCAASAEVEIFLVWTFELGDDGGDGLVDAALQVHRVDAGGHGLAASRTMA